MTTGPAPLYALLLAVGLTPAACAVARPSFESSDRTQPNRDRPWATSRSIEGLRGPEISLDSALESPTSSYRLVGLLEIGASGAAPTLLEIALNGGSIYAVPLVNGRFHTTLELNPGTNTLEVWTADASGTANEFVMAPYYNTGKPGTRATIDAAEQAGTLTAERALIYRAWAAFGDKRLPKEYRGDESQDSYLEDVPDQIIRALPTLSPEARETLGVFLTPPFLRPAPNSDSGSPDTGASLQQQP